MALAGMLFFIMIIIGFIQTWLSTRRNSSLGLILPAINILISTVIAMMSSDFFIAFFVLFTTLTPIVIWLGIYKICRIKVEKKIQNNINRMKIKDL